MTQSLSDDAKKNKLAYIAEYNAKTYKRITVFCTEEEREKIRAAAAAANESINAYSMNAIRARLESGK